MSLILGFGFWDNVLDLTRGRWERNGKLECWRGSVVAMARCLKVLCNIFLVYLERFFYFNFGLIWADILDSYLHSDIFFSFGKQELEPLKIVSNDIWKFI